LSGTAPFTVTTRRWLKQRISADRIIKEGKYVVSEIGFPKL
jgi:hypothetical protein